MSNDRKCCDFKCLNLTVGNRAACEECRAKSTARCALCRTTPVPDCYGSPRKCAFDENGEFTSDNWNCETAARIRALMGESEDYGNSDRFCIRRDDQSYGALWVPPHPEDIPDGEVIGPWRGGGMIAGYWYKSRGQTEMLIRVDARDGGQEKDAAKRLTVIEAEAAIKNIEARMARSAPVVDKEKERP